jgi:hypothetical protein
VRGVRAVGHDPAELARWFASADHDGVCDFDADEHNVLATTMTVYRYEGIADPAKVRVARLPLVGVPYEALIGTM